jgi:hypothetical protein
MGSPFRRGARPRLMAANVSGGEDGGWVSFNISGTPLIAGDQLSYTITGVPTGFTLSAGTLNSSGAWLLTGAQIASAKLAPPAGYVGTLNLTVAVVETALLGYQATSSANFSAEVKKSAATISIDPVGGNNQIELASGFQIITGEVTDSLPNNIVGQTVSLTLAGRTYTTTVQANETWSVTIDTKSLINLANNTSYTINASVVDAVGNNAKTSATPTTVDHASISIDPIGRNGYLNADFYSRGSPFALTITGTASASLVNTFVYLDFMGVTYRRLVSINDSWSIFIPDVQAGIGISDSSNYTVDASAIDSHNVTVHASASFAVDLSSSLTIDLVGTNNQINVADAALTVSGHVTDSLAAAAVGQTVSVFLLPLTQASGGHPFTGTVNADGTWSVSIDAGQLGLQLALQIGTQYNVSAAFTDTAGNASSANMTVLTVDSPLITINPINGNGYFNYGNSKFPNSIAITGTASDSLVNQTITAHVNGQTYIGRVRADHTWSINAPAAALMLHDGAIYTVTASATDIHSVDAAASASFTTDLNASIIIDQSSTINLAGGAATITGTVRDSVLGSIVHQNVRLQLLSKTYIGTVQSDGTWSVTIDAASIARLPPGPQYKLTASVTDKAGNSANNTLTIPAVYAPFVTIDPIGGNGLVNGAGVASGITITGIASASLANMTISLLLNGQSFSGAVKGDHTWSITVPAAAASLLTDASSYTVSASAIDSHNVIVHASASFTTDKSASVTIDPVGTNNQIDVTHALTVSGHVTDSVLSSAVGQTVSVFLLPPTQTSGAQPYTGTVNADGTWSVSIDAGQVASLPINTQYNVSAAFTDAAGNAASANTIVLTVDNPLITINPINKNGYVNGNRRLINLVAITGTASASLVNQTITANVNGQPYTASVQADHTWSINAPVAALMLHDGTVYTVTASATDIRGVGAAASASFTTDLNASIIIDQSNKINLAGGAATITGTVGDSVLESIVGQEVRLQLLSNTYIGAVQADRTWSVTIDAASIAKLPPFTSFNVTASVTDKAGNSANIISTIPVFGPAPIAMNLFGENGLVNGAGVAGGTAITGAAATVQNFVAAMSTFASAPAALSTASIGTSPHTAIVAGMSLVHAA